MSKDVCAICEQLNQYVDKNNCSYSHYSSILLHKKSKYLDKFIENKPFPPFEVEIQMSSHCDLFCKWCIGGELQEKKRVLKLGNRIKGPLVDKIVDDIINLKIDGLGIETVKFSGFIGEPLLVKPETLRAIKLLSGAGKKVGLFTNGVLMSDDVTMHTLLGIDYVHISLDAGRSSFFWLKESSMPQAVYSEKKYELIIDNIALLNKLRIEEDSRLKINIGYVIVPGNHDHIYETGVDVKNAGADSIRFKCDIGGRFALKDIKMRDIAYEQIDKLRNDAKNSSFDVNVIHSKKDIEDDNFNKWKACDHVKGCFYHNFMGTIGSDGNLYFCDHNTMPSAVHLGSIVDEQSFEQVWMSERRKYLTGGLRYLCHSDVCPPFGNSVNNFLEDIDNFREKYGAALVLEAIDSLRKKYPYI